MFDGICILTALYLFFKADEDYRNMAFVVLAWFVVSDVVYNYLLLDFRHLNQWFIYILYSVINLVTIYYLRKLKSFSFLINILRLNVLLNIVASSYFISDWMPKEVFEGYAYPAGAIMLINIFYLWIMGNGDKLIGRHGNNRDRFFGFLGVRHGLRVWKIS